MMFSDPLDELAIIGVFDRGIPNKERIVLCANESLELAPYGLMLGIRGSDGFAVPIRDNLLWFGNGLINKGDWIFVYSGPGEPKVTEVPNNTEKMYSVHWGRKKVILSSSEVVPILFRMDAVRIHVDAPDLPVEREDSGKLSLSHPDSIQSE